MTDNARTTCRHGATRGSSSHQQTSQTAKYQGFPLQGQIYRGTGKGIGPRRQSIPERSFSVASLASRCRMKLQRGNYSSETSRSYIHAVK